MWDWVFDSKGLHPQSLTEIVILMVECLFVASSVDFRLDTQSAFMRLFAIEKTNYNLFDFLTMRVYVPLLEYTQYLREGIRDMRLLLVEDDLKIAFFVKTGLEESGFAVDHAEDGEDGLHLALTEPYDLCIIDIMLPKIDGLTIIAELRRKHINTPVLILSAKRSVDDRVIRTKDWM